MKAVTDFFKSRKNGIIVSFCAFIIAIVTAVSCGVLLAEKKDKPEISISTAETVTPRNSGWWTDSGNYATSYAGGDGTEDDPYLISNGAEFAKLAIDVNAGNKYAGQYFKLTSSIDLLDYYWTPIGNSATRYFGGVFNADGFNVEGMVISSTYAYTGLFGYVSGEGSINDLSLKDCSIAVETSNTMAYYGGLVASLDGTATLTNCSVTGSISVVATNAGLRVGGLVGLNYSTGLISSCRSNTVISAQSTYGEVYVGGITAYNASSKIEKSYNSGSLTGEAKTDLKIGGLVGYGNTITIDQSFNSGVVTTIESSATQNVAAGGLVGECYSSSSISNSYNSGAITGVATTNSYIGGIIGDVYNGQITADHVYNIGSVTATGSVGYGGGFIGKARVGSSVDSFSLATISASTSAGGIIGYASYLKSSNQYFYLTNIYYDSSKTSTDKLVAADGTGVSCTNSGGVSGLTSELTSSAKYTGTLSLSYVSDTGISGKVRWGTEWDFTNKWTIESDVNNNYPTFKYLYWKYSASSAYAGGTGTEADPYLISNSSELAKLADDVNNYWRTYAGIHFKLTSNINLGGKEWEPISTSSTYSFSGNFDGDNYSINGMTIKGNYEYAGLFGCVDYKSNPSIKNLLINDAEIENQGTYTGGLIGDLDSDFGGSVLIENCFVSGNITGSESIGVGGIAGWANFYGGEDKKITISNCINKAKITGTYSSAGIIGYGGIIGCSMVSFGKNEFNLINCINMGAVTGESCVGGILGRIDYSLYSETASLKINITNCNNTGNVLGTAGYIIGGLLGGASGSCSFNDLCEMNFVNSFVECDVSGLESLGGLFGNLNNSTGAINIKNCYFKGTITTSLSSASNPSLVGGIIGRLYCNQSSVVQDCFAVATINAPNLTNLTYVKADFGYMDPTNKPSVVQNYYVDVDIVGKESTITSKTYVGATDGTSESFGSDAWFYSPYFKGGELTLKGIYHIGKGIMTTSEENIAKLESLGYTAA